MHDRARLVDAVLRRRSCCSSACCATVAPLVAHRPDAAAVVRLGVAVLRPPRPHRCCGSCASSARCATSAARSTTLWAGRSFTVARRAAADGPGRLPFVAVADPVPFGVAPRGRARPRPTASCGASEPLELSTASTARCRAWPASRGCASSWPTCRASSPTSPSSATRSCCASCRACWSPQGGGADGQAAQPAAAARHPPAAPARLAAASCSTCATTCPATRRGPSPGRCRPAATG